MQTQSGLLGTSTSSPSRIFVALFTSLSSSRTSKFSYMAFVICEQPSGIQNRSLRTETRNLKIQDGEDIDVLRRPEHNQFLKFLWWNSCRSTSERKSPEIKSSSKASAFLKPTSASCRFFSSSRDISTGLTFET